MANNKLDGSSSILNGDRLADNFLSQAAGIISTKPTAKYASGARCILRVNGRLIGFAFGISWRINTMAQEIMTIDDYMPHEIAPQRITVEGTISSLHIPGQGPSAELIQSNVLSFLFQKYITIEVRDSATNALLFFTDKAMVIGRGEDIRVDQLANLTLNWKAIGWKDEKGASYPTNYDKNTDAKIKTGTPVIDQTPFRPTLGGGNNTNIA